MVLFFTANLISTLNIIRKYACHVKIGLTKNTPWSPFPQRKYKVIVSVVFVIQRTVLLQIKLKRITPELFFSNSNSVH